MQNLISEMNKYGVDYKDIQQVLNCSSSVTYNKANGIMDLTYFEALIIRNELFPELEMEYLFKI